MNAAQSVLAAAAAQANTGASAQGQHTVLPGQSPAGGHILSVLLKRTYDIVPDGRCVRAKADTKIIAGDRHFGDPQNTTVQYEADFVPYKLATDVVVAGHAYAPEGKASEQFTAAIAVGEHRKEILVLGDRQCRYRDGTDPLFTEPKPIQRVPLRYEYAYGGVDVFSDPNVQTIYGRNHMGRGFVIANTKQTIDKLALPNFEDPKDRLAPERLCIGHFMHWERQPMPAGFGWFSKYWKPRASYAGVMPADRAFEREMRKAYRTLVPKDQLELYDQTELPDMDFRFFNGASPGLALPYLRGDERVVTTHLTPRGQMAFELPGDAPTIGLDIGEGMKSTPARLQTVMIRLDEHQVDLVWRSGFPYPGRDWLPQMKRLDVGIH